MIWYLLWRIMTGRHTSIQLSFLVVGHTKFAPDWCFGLFKRLLKRTRVGSLQALADVVQKSAKCNEAQLGMWYLYRIIDFKSCFGLVVDENGKVIVPTYDWISFFATRFKKLIGIKKGHHFSFISSQPGMC